MIKGSFKLILILLVVIFAIGLLPGRADGLLYTILEEHFNRDPREHSWPWTTYGGKAWYFNTENWPVPRNLCPVYPCTPCGWGWVNGEDAVYNTLVTPEVEAPNEQGSLWCAYSTREGRRFPQWPDEDEYWNNMNAWAIWGPFNLRYAVGGFASFWIHIDLDHYARDSLSVCLVNNDGLRCCYGNTFRTQVGIGKTFCTRTPAEWLSYQVHFDSLYVDGELTSYLKEGDEDGERRCWLCFVWHSDNRDIAGTGAFIDDIYVSWDDGMFDIHPVNTIQYGHPVAEDSIFWTRHAPSLRDEVYIKCEYVVVGSVGYLPSFDVELTINEELFFTTTVDSGDVEGNDTLTYEVVTDELWSATRGAHILFWELDVGDDVDESIEDNNTIGADIEVEWNPPPIFDILTPAEDLTPVPVEDVYNIWWTVQDSNEFDTHFQVILFWTDDTSGWSENTEVMYDWNMSMAGIGLAEGSHVTPVIFRDDQVEVGDTVYIAGVARDSNPDNSVFVMAPGSVRILPRNYREFEILKPVEDMVLLLFEDYTVSWSLADISRIDQNFDVSFYWTDDTSGWSFDHRVISGWNLIGETANYEQGEHEITHRWDDPQLHDIVIYLAAVADDGEYPVYSLAPGAIRLWHPDVVSGYEPEAISDYSLDNVWPNPFNRGLSIGYSLPTASVVKLLVFDLSGRQVATLVDGFVQEGRHTYTWHPSSIPAGVYMVRLVAAGHVLHRKVIYMP